MSHDDGGGLAEAQIAAIEDAFAEHDRMLARLRGELAELRRQPADADNEAGAGQQIEERLSAVETRLEQQEQALRHVLQRLIAFFERTGPDRV